MRIGKHLAFLLTAVAIVYAGVQNFVSNALADNKVDVAIVFLLDRSPSMNPEELQFARESHARPYFSRCTGGHWRRQPWPYSYLHG